MAKKQSKPSVVRELNGLPKSTEMFTKTVDHPEGVKYTKGDNKGEVKRITQHYADKACKNVIADGYSDNVTIIPLNKFEIDKNGKRVKVTLKWIKYDGNEDCLTEKQLQLISDMNTAYQLESKWYKAEKLAEDFEKLLNYKMTPEQAEQFSGMVSEKYSGVFTLLINKANGVKAKDNTEPDTLVSFG